ncbi:MAG: SPW repeat protein [Bryobacteraceae bacterium]
MWPRDIELSLGLWLIVSPFVFRHPAEAVTWWANDMLCGLVVVVFSLLSYSVRFHWAHFFTIAVAIWLYAFARFSVSFPPPAALQNNAVVGLLLALFAVLPNEAERPPRPWRRD